MSFHLGRFALWCKRPTVESILNWIGILILSTIFLFWDGSRALYVISSLFALGFLIVRKPDLPLERLLYSLPILFFIGAILPSLLYHGMPDRGLNYVTSRYLLLLLAVPLASLFYLTFNADRNLWFKFVLACFVLGIVALIEIFVFDKNRANGGGNAVIFGAISLATTSITLASYNALGRLRFGKLLYVLAIFSGFAAILLSGTRSSWLIGAVIITIAIIFYFDRYSLSKRILISLLLITSIVLGSLLVPKISMRAENMVKIVAPYLTGEEHNRFTSVRYRIEVWKAAWSLGMENRAFGVGPGNFKNALKSHVKANEELGGLEVMKHAHNSYMQIFATTGIIGLVGFLVMLVSHLYLFARYLFKQNSSEVRSLALAGCLLVIAYILGSMLDVLFEAKNSLLMYGFSSATLWGCLLGESKNSAEPDGS